jgi:hypothetical protein
MRETQMTQAEALAIRATWHLARLPGITTALVERTVHARGFVAAVARFGLPYTAGSLVAAALCAPLPTWARVLLLALSAVLTLACALFNHVDEQSRFAMADLLASRDAALVDADRRAEKRWRGVAEENANEGVKLAVVMLDHIAKIGGEEAVAKAHEALVEFERNVN